MKLVTFEINGRSAVGLLNADATAVHPVPGCADMQTLIGLWPALDTVAVLRSAALPLAASIKVYGPYENIAPVYASFARWLEDHPALRMAGPTCEVAHRGPWNADDPQDYLTEFLVPVRKTA